MTSTQTRSPIGRVTLPLSLPLSTSSPLLRRLSPSPPLLPSLCLACRLLAISRSSHGLSDETVQSGRLPPSPSTAPPPASATAPHADSVNPPASSSSSTTSPSAASAVSGDARLPPLHGRPAAPLSMPAPRARRFSDSPAPRRPASPPQLAAPPTPPPPARSVESNSPSLFPGNSERELARGGGDRASDDLPPVLRRTARPPAADKSANGPAHSPLFKAPTVEHSPSTVLGTLTADEPDAPAPTATATAVAPSTSINPSSTESFSAGAAGGPEAPSL